MWSSERAGRGNPHPRMFKMLMLRRAPGRRPAGIFLLAVACLAGCRAASPPVTPAGQAPLKLTSSSFQGDRIPAKFTCDGAGTSPQFAWNAPPAATASLALLVTDPDAPGGTFVHWILYNLPAATRELPEGQSQLPSGARQGRNDFGNIGYGGPCPPGKSAHHYVFSLYALDVALNLPQGAALAEIKAAMQGHILAHGELIALYPR
jgi:Raf kinase inhibitor-like YbhB/YbcL family protein